MIDVHNEPMVVFPRPLRAGSAREVVEVPCGLVWALLWVA